MSQFGDFNLSHNMMSTPSAYEIRHGYALFFAIVVALAQAANSLGFGSYDSPAYRLIRDHGYFTGNVPEAVPLPGLLSGSRTASSGSVNLTAEGTSDWAHWGMTDASSFNHNGVVAQQISNVVPLGVGTIQQYTESPTVFSWTGGAPIATAGNIDSGIYCIGSGNGFQLTVPADTQLRTLRLYVGVWAATGRIEGSLSDGSAPIYVDTGLVNPMGTSNAVYTIDYRAGSSAQTLTVRWTVETAHNQFGNATLQAATLRSQSTPDTIQPTVRVSGLRRYGRISNQVPVTVQAVDNTAVSRIELLADQTLLSSIDVNPNAPNAEVTFDWNTTVVPNGKTMFRARAVDAAGNSQTSTLPVLIRNSQTTLPNPTATLAGSPISVSAGQTARLSWTTTNATSVTIDQGIGSVAINGSVTVSPSATTTYRLTASNPTGTVSATANITVISPTGNNIGLLPAVRHQTIGGWEATDQAGQLYSPAWNNYKNSLFDQAVNDLGINRVRLEIPSGIENPNDYFTQWRNGVITESQYRALAYEIVNDNSDPGSINPNGFKWAFVEHSIENVVLPLRQRLLARGESLWVNANYVDFGSSSFEHKNNPAEYAEFVLAAYRHMQNRYGFVPDSWEVILEPDTQNAGWSAAQVAQAIKMAGDLLVANNFTPNFVAPSTTDAGNASGYIDQIAQTTGAMAYVGEFSYHRYSGGTNSILQAIASRAVSHNKKTSMLEWIGADHNTLHQDLKFGRVSSWQQYTLAFPNQPDNGAQYYLINDSSPNNPVISIGSRSKFLRQYFRYVRTGAQRIEAVTGNPNFDPVAFINSNGRYAVVVKALSGGAFGIQGLPAGTYGLKYTTGSEYGVDLPDVVVVPGQTLTASIPTAGVITIYAR